MDPDFAPWALPTTVRHYHDSGAVHYDPPRRAHCGLRRSIDYIESMNIR